MQSKLLNIFSFTHPLGSQLVANLSSNNVDVSSIYMSERSKFSFWRAIFLTILNKDKKTVFFHSMGMFNIALLTLLSLAPFEKRLISVFWGTDFNSMRGKKRFGFYLVSILSSKILFANEAMAETFVKQYGRKSKVRIVRFGLEALNDIDFIQSLNKNNHQKETVKIHVCSNSSPNQQTVELIPYLEIAEELALSEGIYLNFVFNLSYGDAHYKEKVLAMLAKSKLKEVCVDTKFRTGADLANHRIDTDILINVQKADMLSGAMQEVLYAGNKVITGNWLDYSCLTDNGCSLYKLSTTNELPSLIIECLQELSAEQISINKEVIASISKWDNAIGTWLRVLND